MDFLFPEELSTSPPHIFFDSNSVCSERSKQSSSASSKRSSLSKQSSSSPHMFLSYANPNATSPNRSDASSSRRSQNSGQSIFRFRKKKRNNSTPHLFLNYAGSKSSSCSLDEEDIFADGQQYTEWGNSLQTFESKCSGWLQSAEQNLPNDKAAQVASSLRFAANEAAENKQQDKETLYSFYASIVNKTLGASNDFNNSRGSSGFDSTESVARESEMMSSSQQESYYKNKAMRQQEEINFLRSALKALVQPMRQEDTNPAATQTNKAIRVRKGSHRDANSGIPKNIEIPRILETSDDVSEQCSQLTPSVAPPRIPKFQMVVQPFPSRPEVDPTFVDPAFNYPSSVQSMISKQHTPFIPSLETASKSPQSAQERYLQTMQLVYSLRNESRSRKSMITDMGRGEIQPSRARGMKFELLFRNWNITISGRYSGALKNGLPNGSGVLRFDNRDLYIGTFLDGALHGEGTLFCRRDSKLVTLRGEFHSNEFIGHLEQHDDATSAGAA